MLLSPMSPVVSLKERNMREEYYEYMKEHPEELENVVAVIERSKAIQEDRENRIKEKLALIQKCREELANEARNKRS